MLEHMIRTLALVLLFAPAFAEPPAETRRVLVELFTSQG